ncbi:vacuolar sorting-associated 9a [Fusarium beomiforme]|uniref:Vacuolar sorting-associated 9a n=1 Tax=Fusarium beomiforme TaxID=44412 RepID=A0A9P5DWN9_9HYPO|nr:vacuolar sorting-associated 9a [Fusarium beomiforme]
MSPPEQSTSSSSQPVLDETLSNKPNVELTSVQGPAAGDPETTDDHDHISNSGVNTGKEDNLIDFGDQPADALSREDKAEAAEQEPSEMIKGKQAADDQHSPSSLLNTRASAGGGIKPIVLPSSNDNNQYLTAEPSTYVDPTPATPTTSQPPSRTPSNAARSHISGDSTPPKSDAEYDERRYLSEDDHEGGSQSEIQSIMEQFSEFGGGPGEEEVMSPRLEIASPMLGHPVQHPPRKSSLEPLVPTLSGQMQGLQISTSFHPAEASNNAGIEDLGPPVPPKDGVHGTPPRPKIERNMSVASPSSPAQSHRPPPPEPEPEPAQPFDFHRFLEQLRNKKADPVARYLKSFLSEFGKRQWMVHEQVKIIGDFLAFIANKMAQCEVWRDVSDAEFDNAREGMEKLVMNRLYTQTFSPAIQAPKPIPGAKPKRRGGDVPLGPGRRGQHQEDVERDDIVRQKMSIYGWVREEHLDIPPVGDSGRRFLKLAQQELLKIKSYRAPRDKIICVLNCCKVIFGLLKHNKSDSSADSFMPLLIYVVLQSNPEHLVSNVQYILRFRNQEKLGGEAGYYLSSLMGAVQFIENMDRTTLTITDEEFEKHVEEAVSAIAEKHAQSPQVTHQPVFNEKSGPPLGELSTRPSLDGPRTSTSNDEYTGEEKAAITGLLKTIQKPLSSIGRMFSDEPGPSMEAGPSSAPRTPAPQERQSREEPREPQRPSSKHALSAEEAAARQASAEAAEAQRLSCAEHANVVETLAGMFPDLDKDVISDVVYEKEGRVGLAVDACLALST